MSKKMNKQKPEFHKLLEHFAQFSKDGVQISNLDGEIIYLNRVAKNRLGITQDKKPVFIWDFEPFFKGVEDWREHVKMLKTKGEFVVRSVNRNLSTNQMTPIEVMVNIYEIDNVEYVFAITKDIKELLQQEKRIERREKMLLAISEATTELLNNNDLFSAVAKVLETIGKAVNVDRTYLFTVDKNNSELVSQRSEWNSGEANPQIDNPDLQGVPLSLFDDFLVKMHQKQPFQSIVENLPDSPLKEILLNQQIVSILIIPVFHKGKFWGFIGYDECKFERVWHEVELSILQTLSNNMSAAIDRLEKNKEIQNLAEFPMENPAPIIRIDRAANILFHNKLSQIENELFTFLDEETPLTLKVLLRRIAKDSSKKAGLNYYEVRTNNAQYFAITAKQIGGKSYTHLYFSDITKLKATEKELNKTKTIVDQVVNNMEDVVWSVSYPDYKALYISPSVEMLYGIPVKAFYEDSQIWKAPIIPEDKDKIKMIFDLIEATGESDVEYRISTNSGIKWVNNRTKAVYNNDAEIIRIDGLISDITKQKHINQELKEAKEKAIQSNKAKENFIANISHEIRTPLNAIIGLSNILNEDNDSAKTKEYIDHILHSGMHLRSLIENVLDMTKISEGKIELQNTTFQITELTKTLQSIFAPLFEEKGLRLTLGVDENIAHHLTGDYLRIKQILINIISNALKYTDNGTIFVQINVKKNSKNRQEIEFSIQDTGLGMEKEYLKEIFHKFSRSKRTDQLYSGAGLGMAISYELVKLMNGEITVESVLGEGTTVFVKLPLTKGKAIKKATAGDSFSKPIQPLIILHAEDNPLNRLIVKKMLEKYAVELIEVEDGGKAIEEIKEKNFDCILLDIQMPVKDGFQVAEKARKKLKLTTPIIGLSANALTSQIEKSKKYGINKYLTKPFSVNELTETINQLIAENDKRLCPKNQTIYYDSNALAAKEYDAAFRKELKQMFIENTSKSLEEIKHLAKNKEFAKIKRLFHKIKPSIELFGIRNTKSAVYYFMSTDEANTIEWGIVNKHLKEFIKNTSLAIEQMKSDSK
jgi:signal transduction histidine kinase/CheY-like chemotaxis protein